MTRAKLSSPTFIGQVSAVRGGEVMVRLRSVPTTLVMVDGETHRIGQIGSFVRIPLGFTNLYGVCTQVGASSVSASGSADELLEPEDPDLAGFRWMTVALFGESTQGQFERGVAQYPTVGDEVHLVTVADSAVMYNSAASRGTLTLGHISGAPSIPARLDISSIVTRHACVVGSTGSGKSNLMAVLLRAIATSELQAARVLVVDPHGEYASALDAGTFSRLSAELGKPGELRVPYWALTFENFAQVALGPISESHAEYIRDHVRSLKVETAKAHHSTINLNDVTADSPIPFSIRRLWFSLQELENATFTDQSQTDAVKSTPVSPGDESKLIATTYPPPGAGSAVPYQAKSRKGIGRPLEYLRTRVLDPRYSFMFAEDDFEPSSDGHVNSDLDDLLSKWIGSDRPITVLDVSALPPEIVTTIVGGLLALVYQFLFWGMDTPVGGRRQPLLVVIDEAHRFLPSGTSTPASLICTKIAREGRKYGIGLLPVTQRPSDIDATILSQCGSLIALRVTNASDRAVVANAVPDDLGNLIGLLPSLRTGECLVVGETLPIPSRVRINRAPARPVGDDPTMPDAWLSDRPSTSSYADALANWRAQSLDH